MQSGNLSSRKLAFFAALFIFSYFLLFSYNGLSTHLSFDDGMNFIAMHHQWEVPAWRNILDCLKVFTTATRPLGALFYRPMYYFFGFDPVPYRIVVYLLLTFNIILAYRFARALGATREAATLSTLLFSYNASLFDLFYNTGTIYDLMCFALYIGALLIYIRERSKCNNLSTKTMVIVGLLFLASLDAKEMSVILPAALLFYELLYRQQDFKSRVILTRVASFIAVTGIISAIFLKVKVTDMSANKLYHPQLSVPFVLKGMGHYFEQFFYRPLTASDPDLWPSRLYSCWVQPLSSAAARWLLAPSSSSRDCCRLPSFRPGAATPLTSPFRESLWRWALSSPPHARRSCASRAKRIWNSLA